MKQTSEYCKVFLQQVQQTQSNRLQWRLILIALKDQIQHKNMQRDWNIQKFPNRQPASFYRTIHNQSHKMQFFCFKSQMKKSCGYDRVYRRHALYFCSLDVIVDNRRLVQTQFTCFPTQYRALLQHTMLKITPNTMHHNTEASHLQAQ